MYNKQCTMYNKQCTINNVQCTINNVQELSLINTNNLIINL